MTVPWLALGAGVLLLAPLTARFFRNLWTREPYQFFPLAVAAALLLAVRTWQESDPGPVEVRAWRRWAALVPALVVAVAEQTTVMILKRFSVLALTGVAVAPAAQAVGDLVHAMEMVALLARTQAAVAVVQAMAVLAVTAGPELLSCVIPLPPFLL